MGTFKDKNIESMDVKMKHAFAEVHTVTATTERGMNATKLADILERILSQKIYPHQDIPLEAVVDTNINRCTKVPLVIIIFGSLSLSKQLDRYL